MSNELFRKIAIFSDEDLIKELMQYPNVESLRKELKGYMSSVETNVKTKERLIDKVLERRKKGAFISQIGKKLDKSLL